MAGTEKEKEFSNWICNVLALNVSKTALHSFVIDTWVQEISSWKIESEKDFIKFLQDVENGNVKVKRNVKGKKASDGKHYECLNHHESCQSILEKLVKLRQDEQYNISFQTKLGEKIIGNDVREPDVETVFREVSGNTRGTSTSAKPKPLDDYNHIFPGCKMTHIWCIANMFMQSESFRNDICNTSPADTDAAMFFRMMKNCKLFALPGAEDLYQEIIEIRNKLHHSEVNRVETKDYDAYLKTMKHLLEQFPSARKDREDAIKEIEEMKDRRFLSKDSKKAMLLKMFALETDTKVAKSKGQRYDEKEYLQMEDKEQFKNTRFTQIPINKTMKEKESDKKNKERLLSSARDIKMQLHDVREKRLEVTNAIEENSQGEDCLDIIGNLREELQLTSKELTDLSHHVHTYSKKEDGNGLEETSTLISDPDINGICDIGDFDFEDPVTSKTDMTTQHTIGILLIQLWWRCFVAKRDDIQKFDLSQLFTYFLIEDRHRFDEVAYKQLKSEYFEMIRSLDYDREENTVGEESNSASADLFKSDSDRDTLWVFPFPAGVRESAKERYDLAVKKVFASYPSGYVLAPNTLLVLKYFMSVPTSFLNMDGNVSEAQKKRPFENGTTCMVVVDGYGIETVSTFKVIDSGTIKELASSVSKWVPLGYQFLRHVKDGVYQKELGLVDTLVFVSDFRQTSVVEQLRFTGKCIISSKEDDDKVWIKGGLLYGDSPLSLLK